MKNPSHSNNPDNLLNPNRQHTPDIRLPEFFRTVLAVVLVLSAILTGCSGKGSDTPETSDTLRWFYASYAILTELNGNDYTEFGGMPINDYTRQLQIAALESQWGVTDRETADSTLAWALEEGHRTEFVNSGKYLAEDIEMDKLDEEDYLPYLLYISDLSEEEAAQLVNLYIMYKDYGEHAIDAWDYCRALNLLSFYYVAGYYTKEEALDKSLEIAGRLQPMYSSWDELVESYLRGYEYWAEESSAKRRAVYEDLKTREDNPFSVDYHTVLEKSW
ncbi:MAG: DUF1266 domain-containing protein [Clostridium sp.]|nr:DUF1266 domain-containing protein [Clostridium sp.]